MLSTALGLDTRITTLGHVQRGGNACAYDRQLSTLQGTEAVKAVLEATPETPSKFIAIIENKIVRNPLIEAVQSTAQVAEAIKDKNFKRALELRGPEFAEYYSAVGFQPILSYLTISGEYISSRLRTIPKKPIADSGIFIST